MPETQDEYQLFINALTTKKIHEEGPYKIYEINNEYSLPHFYVADILKPYDNKQDDWYGRTMSFFVGDTSTTSAYIERKVCLNVFSKKRCEGVMDFSKQKPRIAFEKINPTKYIIHIKNARGPYLFVFSETYHPHWQIFLSQSNSLLDFIFPHTLQSKQILVNGYANAWYILPKDVDYKSDYILTVQMSDQRIFYLGVIISLITLEKFWSIMGK